MLYRMSTTLVLILMTLACGVDPSPLPTVLATAIPTNTTKQVYMRQMRDAGVDKYLGVVATTRTTSEPGNWTAHHFNVEEGAVCRNGDDFIVSTRPSSAGSQDILIYLQGGGGCWDNATCNGVPFATEESRIPSTNGSGIFDMPRRDNPLRKWNYVYVTYCDGSVFSGDNIVHYNKDQKTYHWGIRNLSAAVNVAKKQFPNAQRVSVMGSSAGGFGTHMAVGVARLAFPDAQMFVLNDAGPGVENPDRRSTQGVAIRENWKFEQFIPKACTNCFDNQLMYVYDYALRHDPDLRIGFFANRNDFVIGWLFLEARGAYPEIVRETTQEIHENHPERFRRYIGEGMEHTILGSDHFYTRRYRGDMTMAEWTSAFLEQDLTSWIDLR